MSVWPLPRITFRELNTVHETRPAALLTSDEVWAVLGTQLTLPVLIQAEPARYSRDLLDYLAAHLPSQVKVIYAVGGGAPLEAGKVIAARNHIPLVIVPTALDSTLMFMPAALVEDQVENRPYRKLLEVDPATEIIIDWAVIQSAPDPVRAAGIVDVLSIVTGLLDWRYAAQKGKNPREQRFAPWAAGVATDLAKEAIKTSAAIGRGQRDSLQNLLHLMMLAVQLSNQLGHTRAQQGGEHVLAHILGATTSPGLAYSELVGPCLLFCAALHSQDPAPLREAMQNAHVRLDQIRATDFSLLIDDLATYLADYDAPYSLLNDLDPQSEMVAQALEAAGLALLPETWAAPEETPPIEAVIPPLEAGPDDQVEVADAEVEAEAQTQVETEADTPVEAQTEEEAQVYGSDETHPTEGPANLTGG